MSNSAEIIGDAGCSRRQFLGSSAKNAAGVAVGVVGLAESVAAGRSPDTVRLGVLGVRNQGRRLARAFAALPNVEIASLCDIDQRVLEKSQHEIDEIQGSCPRSEQDFRRVLDDDSVDAVVIATPDHWHAYMAVSACQAGKDLYLEIPVSHTVSDGRQIVAAAEAHGRVIQTGLQQRSSAHFRTAIEYVQSGKLGAVRLAKAWTAHARKSIGYQPDAACPQGVDYDLWLGPAAKRDFNPNRFHQNWRWNWDYGSGELGNWGVQMLDVARWGLGLGLPNRISAHGGQFHFQDDQQTPDTMSVQYAYDDALLIWEHRQWSNHGIEGRSAATAFYGDRGVLVVDRGGWKVYQTSDASSGVGKHRLNEHCQDFVRSVLDRSEPAADIRTGHLSSTMCHLGNIAFRVGRELRWDDSAERFVADADANRMLAGSCRGPWMTPQPM